MNVVAALARAYLEANGLDTFHVAWTWPPPARPEVETLAWKRAGAGRRFDSVALFLDGKPIEHAAELSEPIPVSGFETWVGDVSVIEFQQSN